MDARHVHHSRWLAAVIVLGLILLGLHVFGVDVTSVRIAWYRLRLLSSRPETCLAQVDRLAALGERGTRHLMWCMGHDLDEAQLAAIDVLRQRRETRACPAFIRALDDGSEAVRAAANDALEEVSGTSVGFDPYSAWANRRNAVRLWQDWWAAEQASRGTSTAAEVLDHLAIGSGSTRDTPE